ncbi:hypothetical protein Fmac_027360 [Flemingia macrophylla]|uniref:Uncharacterized protein n=1 Tax=Flemingia macrophylla TaxID=520843 RepID=A0ABD1LHN5_9FABA
MVRRGVAMRAGRREREMGRRGSGAVWRGGAGKGKGGGPARRGAVWRGERDERGRGGGARTVWCGEEGRGGAKGEWVGPMLPSQPAQGLERHTLASSLHLEAIHGKVKQLNIFLCDTYRFGSVLIPKLFTCTTLVTLNLNFSDSVSLILPPSVHLPSLKTLHLKAHVSFSYFKKIFYGSPALELAHLKQRLISCSFLPELKIVRSSQGIQLSSTNEVFDIVIESDRDHDFVRDYLEDHLQKLVKVKASIAVQDAELTSFDAYEVVFDTLKGLRNVESLSLSDFSSWQEYYQYFDSFEMKYTFDDVIPIFENLVKLELDIKDDDSIFWRLPAKCPKLKVDDQM